jgi:hypothetical protein
MMMLNVSKLFLLLLPFYYAITFPFTWLMMLMDYRTVSSVGAGINFIAEKVS